MQSNCLDYRKKNMRFSRFEDFVKELMLKVDDPGSMRTIKEEFEKERVRVMKRAAK